jgi:hypothetical protein
MANMNVEVTWHEHWDRFISQLNNAHINIMEGDDELVWVYIIMGDNTLLRWDIYI